MTYTKPPNIWHLICCAHVGLISSYCQHSWGVGWGVGSDLLLVHHYILFIIHAVWIAGPGALGLMIYMFLYCTSCYVIYTEISVLYSDDNFFDTTDTASPSTVVLSACHTAHFYVVFTQACARDTCLGSPCKSLLTVSSCYLSCCPDAVC